MDTSERMAVSLGFAAWFQPQLLLPLLQTSPENRSQAMQVGILSNRRTNLVKPTLQTLLFLLSGGHPTSMAQQQLTFHSKHRLFKEEVLHLTVPSGEPTYPQERELSLDLAWCHHFLNGAPPRFDQESSFPASRLETDKTFDDLVLSDRVHEQLRSPMNFVRHRQSLFEQPEKRGSLNHGYVVMLYGPPGTGKTLTASVMGKHLGVEVYAINLARVISKYIGETEKNLERVFDRLENKNCILFFDEADALFGKRTDISEAKDRYANQEVAYLLQKIEHCKNLVILSTNYRKNLDDAFQRRILSYIKIDAPRQPERLRLWQSLLPPAFHYQPAELAERLAEDYQLTGANIGNILKLACLDAESTGTQDLNFERIEHFLRLEFIKENRIFQVMKDRSSSKQNPTRYAMPTQSSNGLARSGSTGAKARNVYEAMSQLIDQRLLKQQEKNEHGN
ncbi:MAG: ATP-binding protein [Salibacteraceae bacterium]